MAYKQYTRAPDCDVTPVRARDRTEGTGRHARSDRASRIPHASWAAPGILALSSLSTLDQLDGLYDYTPRNPHDWTTHLLGLGS